MKLEQIFEMWHQDSKIDHTELSHEALRIPQLHHKYFQVYSHERLVLRKYEAELKRLKLDKYEFYTQGPTPETHAKGWQLPPIGKIIKSDVGQYVDSDKDIIELTLKVGVQQEKIELLDSIIRSLNNRGYLIKSAIDFEKFKVGM